MFDALHVVLSGRVQGVGFRYATRAEALRLGLTGWVRNRADGCVEACFEGTTDQVAQILAWCREGPPWASVSEVHPEWTRTESRHDTFEIPG